MVGGCLVHIEEVVRRIQPPDFVAGRFEFAEPIYFLLDMVVGEGEGCGFAS